jgi:hypothetical protein
MQQRSVAGIHIALKNDSVTPTAANTLMAEKVMSLRCSCEI